MAEFPAALAGDDVLASLPVARWGDGSTAHSVLVPDTDGLDHEYWVVRDGHILAKLGSLAAVDDWRLWSATRAQVSQPTT